MNPGNHTWVHIIEDLTVQLIGGPTANMGDICFYVLIVATIIWFISHAMRA